MKRIQNIERILIYYHLRGDIDIISNIDITEYDTGNSYPLGYGIYNFNYYNGLVKNNKVYRLTISNLPKLYSYLKNNNFFKHLNISIELKHPEEYIFNQNVLYGANREQLHFFYSNRINSPTDLIMTKQL